jgi:hypothetical protein
MEQLMEAWKNSMMHELHGAVCRDLKRWHEKGEIHPGSEGTGTVGTCTGRIRVSYSLRETFRKKLHETMLLLWYG